MDLTFSVNKQNLSDLLDKWEKAVYEDGFMDTHRPETQLIRDKIDARLGLDKKEPVKPEMWQLEEWLMDGVCEATDGCRVEPDGRCQHGKPSWFLALGLI